MEPAVSSGGLEGLSRGLAEAVEQAKSQVVGIASGRWRTTGVLWTEPGVVLVPAHAIGEGTEIEARLPDGRNVSSKLLARDPLLNLALVKPDADVAAGSWIGLDEVRLGSLVVLLTRARELRARLGMVAELGGPVQLPFGGQIDTALEVDLVGRGGGLSGALVDAVGRKIALHLTFGRGRRGVYLPKATLDRVVPQLLAEGRIRRGYLGVVAHPVPLPKNVAGEGRRSGLLVLHLEPGSPAERAGMLFGDVLVSVFGTPTGDLEALWRVLGSDRVGEKGEAEVLRAGALQTLSIELGQRP